MFARITLHDFARPMAKRKEARRYVGPYYFQPQRNPGGWGFYMESGSGLRCARHGSRFNLRIEAAGNAWRHSLGGDEFLPIVARLPRGRGFLAGWTMGAGMCAELDRTIHDSEDEARRAACDEAERACARDIELQEQAQAEWEAEDAYA